MDTHKIFDDITANSKEFVDLLTSTSGFAKESSKEEVANLLKVISSSYETAQGNFHDGFKTAVSAFKDNLGNIDVSDPLSIEMNETMLDVMANSKSMDMMPGNNPFRELMQKIDENGISNFRDYINELGITSLISKIEADVKGLVGYLPPPITERISGSGMLNEAQRKEYGLPEKEMLPNVAFDQMHKQKELEDNGPELNFKFEG